MATAKTHTSPGLWIAAASLAAVVLINTGAIFWNAGKVSARLAAVEQRVGKLPAISRRITDSAILRHRVNDHRPLVARPDPMIAADPS